MKTLDPHPPLPLPHDKTNKMACAPSEDRTAWSSAQSDQSSLSAWRQLGSLATHSAHNKDPARLGGYPEFAGRTFILLVLSWVGSNFVVGTQEKRLRKSNQRWIDVLSTLCACRVVSFISTVSCLHRAPLFWTFWNEVKKDKADCNLYIKQTFWRLYYIVVTHLNSDHPLFCISDS